MDILLGLKILGSILLVLAFIVLLLLLEAVIRTLKAPAKVSSYVPESDRDREEKYAHLLSRMVQVNTVSTDGVIEPEKFYPFHALLAELFPLVHEKLEKTVIDGNLLFTWKGRSCERPLVLMSHQDVVPAEGTWKVPPFSGEIRDGLVWGRGTSDTKCSVMGFFQAVEELLEEGYVPEQDVYLSSSCTEEWAGPGCGLLVEELKRRGVRPYLVCDEGGGIITDPIGGIRGNFAMVGVFEKGKADVVFRAKSNGGHASAPPKGTPIARLAAFVNDVEKHTPFKKEMSPEVRGMFETLAPYGSFPLRLVFGNLWLFGPVLTRLMGAISSQGAAMLQTTIAFTRAGGASAFNVIPEEAFIGANMRFIPHQGMKESLALMEKKAKKYGLTMEAMHAVDCSEKTDIHGEAFALVGRVINETFPGLVMSPYVMTGATDARNYCQICESVVRFAPVVYGPEQMKGMHGLNETIETACLPGCVDFYKNLVKAM